MSVRVMADVWDNGPEDATEASVLLVLADHGNDEGRMCYPSIARIAKRARVSERTVQRVLVSLESAGWLLVKRVRGRGLSNEYMLNARRLKGLPEATVSSHAECAAALPVPEVKGDTVSPFMGFEKGDTPQRKGDICDSEKVTLTTEKGDIDARPIREPRTEPRTRTNTPQPPSWGAAVGDGGANVWRAVISRAAAVRVLRECGIASTFRLQGQLEELIQLRVDVGESASDVAERMIAAWASYRESVPLLRFRWGPKKFFGEGAWADSESWPWDQARLADYRRANLGRNL